MKGILSHALPLEWEECVFCNKINLCSNCCTNEFIYSTFVKHKRLCEENIMPAKKKTKK